MSIRDQGGDEPATISLSSYRYVFVLAQIFHGIGASALISLGVTYLDESVSKKDAPLFIGIFEASFVLGPAIGYEVSLDNRIPFFFSTNLFSATPHAKQCLILIFNTYYLPIPVHKRYLGFLSQK